MPTAPPTCPRRSCRSRRPIRRRRRRSCRGTDSILYELHVRGFSMRNPAIPEALRGTFAALAHPAVDRASAPARRDRGRAHARRGLDRRAASGPRAGSATPGATIRWRSWCPTRGWHPAAGRRCAPRSRPWRRRGSRPSLDVVLNHSGEGDAQGPTVSLRGLDNATYYRLLPGGALRRRHRHRQHAGARPPAGAARWRWTRCAPGRCAAACTGSASTSRPRSGGATSGFDPGGAAAGGDRPGPGAAAAEAASPSRGMSAPAATSSAPFPPPGASGTTASATACAGSGAAMQRRWASLRPASRARPTCSRRSGARRAASISSPRMTASPSPTWSATRSATTRRTARATATARATIIPGTTARKGRPTTRTFSRHGARDQRALLATLLLARGTPMLAMGAELGRTPGRQQQRLCAGQRDRLDRLGTARTRR